MGKFLNIIVIILAVIFITMGAGLVWFFYIPPVSAAILYIDEGTVHADLGEGWVDAENEMELLPGSRIRTIDGSATVILLEGEVMHLEPNTSVILDDITPYKIHIKQMAGETWNKVTKISGVETYEVETPTTVATVRGTEFYVTTGAEDEIMVEEGSIETKLVEKPEKKIILKAQEKIVAQKQRMGKKQAEKDLRPEKFNRKYLKRLKQVREREIKRHQKFVNLAKKQYDVTDNEIGEYLEKLDEGEASIEAAYEKVPATLKNKAARLYKLTKKIKEAEQKREEKLEAHKKAVEQKKHEIEKKKQQYQEQIRQRQEELQKKVKEYREAQEEKRKALEEQRKRQLEQIEQRRKELEEEIEKKKEEMRQKEQEIQQDIKIHEQGVQITSVQEGTATIQEQSITTVKI